MEKKTFFRRKKCDLLGVFFVLMVIQERTASKRKKEERSEKVHVEEPSDIQNRTQKRTCHFRLN